ncbi:hypothetical protein [Acidovorax sp. CCYZU-2555]|uniref:hypothetical protein n=1 Tax=Acidovorax sp. CCYZU-2555 TaxID=2835042 RepID=UPI001BCD8273|nr:hypothetical protein [Acidovorax sp. CCYZU-2555]MBS7778077.1 hypothetical protein [Acidovorax sp. CCYZU-2555]
MSSIQSSGPSLASFQALAKSGEAVALKGGTLQSTTSAKQGFFTRVMNWLRGESSTKVNQDTKSAFIASISKGLSQKGLEDVLRRGGFDADSSKPLTSREIIDVSNARSQLLDGNRELKKLMAEMKPLMADLKKKEAVHAQKTKLCQQSPNERNYRAMKAAGDEVRAARALTMAQTEKIRARA